MVDALIIQGIALARWGKKERAHFIFQKAIEIALDVNAQNKAGLAALTLVEEVDLASDVTSRLSASAGMAQGCAESGYAFKSE